jgi:flavin-dependent dehydrogenase
VRRAAALIVGGGPAGSAAALTLASAGIGSEILERSEGPHDVVCGGFLGWDALAALRRLGLDWAALGARPIRRLRLVTEKRRIEVALPRAAAGLSRRTLDESLIRAAADAGVGIRRGAAVRAVEGRRLRLDGDEEIGAETLILATGKHELRGAARPIDPSEHPVGLRSAVRPSRSMTSELDEVIELHLYDGGYAGLLLQEDGSANLCLSASRARLKAAGGIQPLIAELAAEGPALAERLNEAEALGWAAISGVPYGWRAAATIDRVYRVGDQAAVIASLAGDGIAIALESGAAAARAIAAGESAAEFQRTWSRRSARPVRIAEALRYAAERRGQRDALMRLLGWFPSLAPLAARLTRIG